MHTVTYTGHKPERLDKVLSEQLGSGVSRERIKRAIQAGLCTVDVLPCTSASQKIFFGQTLTLSMPQEESHLAPAEGDVDILWQDDALMVINKSAGLTVHPAPSCPTGTLVQRLLSIRPELKEQEGWRPGIVHRLDKDTSGLIIIAPNEAARLKLATAFAERTVSKTYLTIVNGVPRETHGSCFEPLGRHPTNKTKMAVVEGGREAHTQWDVLYADPGKQFSVLSVMLHTGRTHQIRVHMAHLGHPILGDTTYAPRRIASLAPRQMLHAWKLSFEHPLTGGPCSFICPPPEDMLRCLRTLTHHVEKVVITGLPGCGKSKLTQLMQEQGYPTWNADEIVREAYEPGQDGWHILNHRYRGAFTAKGKPVNKQALAAVIRDTPGMREEIEALIHPIVNQSLAAFWANADAQGELLAFAEVPLWLESGGTRPKHGPSFSDITLVGVECPTAARHDRLIHSRNWLPEMVRAADSWQWPAQKKMKACSYIIDNSKDIAHFSSQCPTLITTLLARRDARHKSEGKAWEELFCQAE